MFSANTTNPDRPLRGRLRFHRIGAAWLGVNLIALLLPLSAEAKPSLTNDYADDAVLLENASNGRPAVSEDTSPAHIQSLIEQARQTGDPRYIGYAEQALNTIEKKTPRLQLLQATVDQSLHRFDAAEQTLETVLSASPSRQMSAQAWLTLANIRIVQGDYKRAAAACQSFSNYYTGLIAVSCTQRVEALTGQAEEAYNRLSRLLEARDPQTPGYSWTQATLAGIATQLGRSNAEDLWQQVLQNNPTDLHSRIQYADWLIRQNRFESALSVTEGYDSVDSLAVLRAVAFSRLSDRSDPELIRRLEQRFEEARWRGSQLHHKDLARFLLDIANRPGDALISARRNWQKQREPLDTALLLRTARRVGDADTLESVNDWLEQHGQRDIRFRETDS